MKKIISTLSVVVFLFTGSVVFQSCESDFMNESIDNSLESIPEQYNEIGIKHNEGLEYFYQELRSMHTVGLKSGTTLNLSKEDYDALAKSSIKDFMRKNGYSISDKLLDNPINLSDNKSFLKSNSSEYIDPILLELQEEITDLINSGIAVKDMKKFKNGLDVINRKATELLSDVDAIAIYAGTSTAFNSFLYWKENYAKWVIALNYPDLLGKYTDEELNRVNITKEGLIENSDKVQLKNWWNDAWSAVGEAWSSTSAAVSNWWDYEGGKEVVAADAGGAVSGALGGAVGSLASGGTLSIPAAVGGGISVGCLNSIDASMQYYITR
jgi:hypothetical protein